MSTRSSRFLKTYSSWENGLAEPHEKNLRRLAKRLSVKEDYFINKESALYTYPLLTPPHQKRSTSWPASYWNSSKVVSLTAYKVLSIELAAGLGHTFMTTKRTMKPSILTKRSHDFAFGYPRFMEPLYPNGSVALMKQTGFWLWWCCLRPHLEWKNLPSRKSIGKRKVCA